MCYKVRVKTRAVTSMGGSLRFVGLWTLLLGVLNLALLWPGVGKKQAVAGAGLPGLSQNGQRTAGQKHTRVGLVFDVGGRGDKSFNDAAFRGVQRALSELDVEAEFVEPGDGADRESGLRLLASRGFDLIIGVGFVFSDDMLQVAKDYPQRFFANIDYAKFDEHGFVMPPQNMVALKFREEEGSFLVGAVAALSSKSHAIGFVGGMDIPLIHKFENGYRQGALAVCADCRVLSGYAGTSADAFKNPAKGKELALGFAVNGLVDEDLHTVLHKGGLKAGQALILTKAIGTGTLFAAHARTAARGRWVQAALQSMVQSNQTGARILLAHGATACTDLTGFGLLGHLVEMTRPSSVDAELDLAALPLLDGAQECVAAGIVSSLQGANVRLRRALRNQEAMVGHPRYPLIFDPQTAGGLLASVPADRAEACIAALRQQGYPHTVAIGRVLAQTDALEPITLRG